MVGITTRAGSSKEYELGVEGRRDCCKAMDVEGVGWDSCRVRVEGKWPRLEDKDAEKRVKDLREQTTPVPSYCEANKRLVGQLHHSFPWNLMATTYSGNGWPSPDTIGDPPLRQHELWR